MKIIQTSLITIAFVAVSCDSKKAVEVSTVEESVPYSNTPEHIAPEYDEVWMMQGWVGFMSVFIGLRDQEFDYIFSSDVGDQQDSPCTGTYSRSRSSLVLHVDDRKSDVHFYSKEWKFVTEDGELKLAAVEDIEKKRGSGRWLRKVNLEAYKYLYNPDDPFLLLFNPHIEKEFDLRGRLAEQNAGGKSLPAE